MRATDSPGCGVQRWTMSGDGRLPCEVTRPLVLTHDLAQPVEQDSTTTADWMLAAPAAKRVSWVRVRLQLRSGQLDAPVAQSSICHPPFERTGTCGIANRQ
ncbi:MAG: hypothetical protein EON54_05540 [Alcaligenaceae bacterium]|nr:MAG: hypothetical protein EON54_05540 [Alcaligenaceae bacterium]